MIDMKDYVGAYQLLAPSIKDVHDFRKQTVKKLRETELLDRQDVTIVEDEYESEGSGDESSYGIGKVKLDLPEYVVRARSRDRRPGSGGTEGIGHRRSAHSIGANTVTSASESDLFSTTGSPMNRSMADTYEDEEDEEQQPVDPEELQRRANKEALLRAKARDKSVDEVKSTALRLEWMLRYHCALSLYHLKQYEMTVEVIN
jgi:hypothetical protein